MSEKIQLTKEWGLRKLQLGDRCEWALQYRGMDWVRMCEFLPSKNAPMAMDDDIRKFSQAVSTMRDALQEIAGARGTLDRGDNPDFVCEIAREALK